MRGWRGRALAAAIGLLGLAILWFGVIDPLLSWYGERQAVLQQRLVLLAHMRDLAAGLAELRAAAARKPSDGGDAATMLAGDSDAVAAADLQERVQKMAVDAGTSLTAVETLPATAEAGHWHKIALRISLTASWPVLVAVVNSIEQSPTRILIDDVHFRGASVGSQSGSAPVQASMLVYGFRAADPAAGT